MLNILLSISLALTIVYLFTSSKEAEDATIVTPTEDHYTVAPVRLPADLYFAGERVPLENFDVAESLDRELLVNTYWHSNTLLMIKNSRRFFDVIEPILKKNGVPDDFKYIVPAESGFRKVVSPVGAAGYWQFMKATARQYNLEVNREVDERYHLEKTTEAACKYFKASYKRFGSWTLAAASYNVGSTHISKQLKRQVVDNYYDLLLNEETARYVYRLLAFKLVLANPEAYGFKIDKDAFYKSVPTVKLSLDTAVADFATYAVKAGVNYKILKYFNPWLRQSYITNKSKKKYELILPKEGVRRFDYTANEKSLDQARQGAFDDLDDDNIKDPRD